MSFGYSTGDFLALLELANELRRRFQDAPTQYKDVSNDVKKLSNVLRVIEDYEPERNLSGPQTGSLELLSQSCHEVLDKLRDSLEKYSHVVSVDRSAKSSIQRAWKKITWDSKEAMYFHEKIESQINHFSLFLAESTLQVVRETRSMVASCTNGVNKILEDGDGKKRLKMLNWLSSNNPEVKHARIWKDRQENTGQWFLKSDKFLQWFVQDCGTPQERRTLFCHGDEGAGKTFISAIVVEELRQRLETDDTVGIAIFYCDFHEPPTVYEIFSSLLKQLLQKSTSQLSGLKSLYDALKKKERYPTEDEILRLLDSAISSLSRVFVVIDALDECRRSGGFEGILRKFFFLQKRHNLGLLVTSRSIPAIAELFQGNPWIRIHADDEDVSMCLRSGLRGFPAIQKTPGLQSEVIATIRESSDGMFLLVRLQLESLHGYEVATAKSIRDKLKTLPISLESAYRETMERIEGQPALHTKIARLVLAWVVWATRPLRSLELQHALAAALEEDSFDEDNLYRIEDIISMCVGIITIDEQSDIVQLQHYTRYEFLKNHWTEFFPDPHSQLTTMCISYMRHETLQVGNTASHSQLKDYLERFPFFEYSAKNWGYHARISYSNVKEQVHAFVQSDIALPQSLRVLFTDRYFSQTGQWCSIAVSPLHPAAYFGLEECILYFIANHVTRDMKDDGGQTALHWAARNGQVEAAELLLNHGLEANLADKKGKTALHYAADQDDSRLIKLLVHYKADMESTDMDGQTPLLTAVQDLKLEPAQELVSLGASIKAMDSMHRSALHLSALGGSRSIHITKFLLARGACYESCDVENMIPMHYAIVQGSEETIEALIQAGACVDAGIVRKRWKRIEKSGRWNYDLSPGDQKASGTRTSHGLTPLHWAALIGHPAMIKYLLSKGADPNKCCQDGDTPLHLAIRADIIRDYNDAWNSSSWRIEILSDLVEAGSEEADGVRHRVSEIRSAVIEVLLSHPSIDVDLQNEQLQTPLHLVACCKDVSMVSFSRLMSKKPDHSICNYKGQTPLHLASGAGKARMVKHLLAARASVDVLDSEGSSPLQYSVRSGKSTAAVVKLLLKCYDMTQLNSCTQKDGRGQNLLHHYLQTDAPSKKLILTLLNHGANVNEIDTEGNSPLSLYLRTSNLIFNRASICRFLLKNGASILWTDESGRNLAHVSMLANPWMPVDGVLSTLSEFGIDIAAKDSNNRGILHHGAMYGSVTQGVVDLLRGSGSLSLHDRDNDGRTPLSYAEAKLHLNRGFPRNRRELTLDVLLKAANGD